MGVYGLLSHCLQRREQCVQFVDLVEVARDKGSIEILVDFYSFEHLLINNLWKSLAAVGNNPYIRLLGGEYRSMSEYLKKLVTDLKSLDIHLVMFVDGAKGSSKVGTEQKLETWKYRHTRDLEKMRDITAVINGSMRIEELPETTNVRPVLLEVQVFETLKACKCEVVFCSSGEADFVIARNLQSRPKAYAVLSNDSDFCIFSCSRFIPHELFDVQRDLQLGSAQVLPEKPIRLMTGVIVSSKLTDMLQLHEHSELIELSIIAGNDFTTPFVKRLKSKVGIHGQSLNDAVQWVREHRRVENHTVIQREMDQNKAFADSIHRSRQFYELTLPADEASLKGFLSHVIDEGIRQGQYPANILSMHLNFYWHRMLLEDTSTGHPCAEVALADLRKYIYRMVLNRQEHIVVEYGRTPYEALTTAGVTAVREDRFLPAINNVQKDKIFQNLRIFHRIMTHYEPHCATEWYKRYGWNVGFICYVLRYFLVLNTGYNLHITFDEYMPLAAMVFCKVDEKFYQSLAILPTMRCITVGNWFQDVYRHAYYFLGKMLFLSHEFAEPFTMFSGSVWTAFYMVSRHERMLAGAYGIPRESIQRIKRDMDYILSEKRHMMKYVVEGYYNGSTRF